MLNVFALRTPLACALALAVASLLAAPLADAAKPTRTNQPPTISGTPPPTATAGALYSFVPTAQDPEGKRLRFIIANQPSWTSFSKSTGALTGTPTTTNVGTFSGIRITVTDGTTSVSLPAFSITVQTASGSTNSPPKISGSPPTSVAVDTPYSFQPVASDANNDPLTFSITNKPSWAAFSSATGNLSGTPAAVDVGTTSNIVISVSDGTASASLAPFSVAVTQIASSSVTLNWTPPIQNTDGSALTDLAGYRISYGQSTSALTQTVQISNPGLSSYVIENISPGTWYFAIKAYTSSGTESALSNAASTTVQ